MSQILEGLQEDRVNEAQWKTMHGNHILVDDNGDILAGGPPEMRKKGVSKDDIKDAVKDANAKSKLQSKNSSTTQVKPKRPMPRTRGEIMKYNKNSYKFLEDNVDKLVKDPLDKEVSNTLIKRWVKGRNWEGGLGSGKDIDRMYANLKKKTGKSDDEIIDSENRMIDFWSKKFENEYQSEKAGW